MEEDKNDTSLISQQNLVKQVQFHAVVLPQERGKESSHMGSNHVLSTSRSRGQDKQTEPTGVYGRGLTLGEVEPQWEEEGRKCLTSRR